LNIHYLHLKEGFKLAFKKIIRLSVITLCFSLLIGCNWGGAEKNSKKVEGERNKEDSKVLHIATSGDIPTLDTTGSMDGLSQTIIQNLFEGLYRLDASDEPANGMAKDFEVSEDGKEYTFYLQEDAKWSNGEPVTAADFVYAWKKALHPDTFSPHAYLMEPIKNAKGIQDPEDELYGEVDKLGVQAMDDYTLEVILDDTVPYFLEILTNPVLYPQNEEFVELQEDKYALEPENMIYNGPFSLKTWDHGAGWVMDENVEYWDKESGNVDRIEYKVVDDTSTMVNLYETDSIDVASLSSEFVDVYEDDEEYNTSLQSEVYFLRFNQKSEYLSNVNIRKAIDMGWDKEGATKSILKDGSLPADYLVPANIAKSPEEDDFRERFGDLNKGSIEKAQEHWKKGLEELGEKEITLELLSYDDGQRKPVSEHIKSQLEENLSGLTITINQQPNKQKIALEGNQDYDISYSGWRLDVNDPIDWLSIFLSDGPYNWQDFENKEFDQLIKKARKDFSDIGQRFSDMQEAERILIDEEAAISPMYQSSSARLIKPFVKEFVSHTNNTITYKWVSIEE